jgi:hypothetical protein
VIGYIILKRKRFNSTPEIAEYSTSLASAENYAQDIYYTEQLDMVLVAEVHKDFPNDEGLRYRKVMKIERTCKHYNIQSDFVAGGMVCANAECRMVFKPQNISSKVEDSLQVA